MTLAAAEPTSKARVLNGLIMVVDDEPINLAIVRKYLADSGCKTVITVRDPSEALRLAEEKRPDVILLDVVMPGISGIEILQQLRASPLTQRIPVLILTASTDAETRSAALENGATDFLAKPIDPHELIPRLRNTLTAKRYEDDLREHAAALEREVLRRTEEIAHTRIEVVHCLARAAEFRDNETGRHVLRVGRYAAVIAKKLGCDRSYVELLELAAALHDVGKIGIPDEILLKPGKLTDDEFALMQRHTSRGARVFERMEGGDNDLVRRHTEIGGSILGEPNFDLLKLAKVIALTHHEKFDGSGYPLGLAGDDIPLAGRIVAVADVFDALSSKRPYKNALPREKCFEILQDGSGKHFDPAILKSFFAAADLIVETQILMPDNG